MGVKYKFFQNKEEQIPDNFKQIAKDFSEKGLKITIKEDKSPVTDGDLEVDKIIRNKILNLTPNVDFMEILGCLGDCHGSDYPSCIWFYH